MHSSSFVYHSILSHSCILRNSTAPCARADTRAARALADAKANDMAALTRHNLVLEQQLGVATAELEAARLEQKLLVHSTPQRLDGKHPEVSSWNPQAWSEADTTVSHPGRYAHTSLLPSDKRGLRKYVPHGGKLPGGDTSASGSIIADMTGEPQKGSVDPSAFQYSGDGARVENERLHAQSVPMASSSRRLNPPTGSANTNADRAVRGGTETSHMAGGHHDSGQIYPNNGSAASTSWWVFTLGCILRQTICDVYYYQPLSVFLCCSRRGPWRIACRTAKHLF